MSVLFSAPASGPAPEARWYQVEAVKAILSELEQHRSTLLVMATGLGKTQCFSEVAKHFLARGQRVLCLAHRTELVQQAAERIHLVTGELVDVEQSVDWASNRARVVCASLQTITQQRRLERFPPDHFGLVIFDEFHHSVAKSFRKPLDHFTGAKVLGVTATTDRGDKKALGLLSDSVAYVCDIMTGIEQGYLVPILGRSVKVKEIDLSGIGKTAGDLQAGALDDEMVKHVEGIVQKTLELEPNRRGIWFFPGVKSAELACDRINALVPNSCAFVSGETPHEERESIMKGFRSGRFQHLTNCAVATEGFDAPGADMVVIGRPTLSRALYAQMVGRGLRVLPGLVDGVAGVDGAEARRSLVASSLKPDCAVIDFAGNAGKHTLVTPEDLLGGKYTEDEVKLAKKKAKENPGGDVLAGLEAARRELKAMMAKLQSKVTATVQRFDPFSVLRMEPVDTNGPAAPAPILARLQTEFKLKDHQLNGLTEAAAHKLATNLRTRRKLGLASIHQVTALQRFGVNALNISFARASRAMQYCADSQWKPDVNVLKSMVEVKR